jgi:Domain of unknown function (DUF3854)
MTRPKLNGSPLSPSWGGPLTDADYAKLERSWITRDLADQALLRRVSSPEGASIVGRRDNGSYEGIIFPYVWPGENHIREYWLRRDHPEFRTDRDGQPKEIAKYLGPPGRGNLLYFVPGTPAEWLTDTAIPVAITEGAKKTIALHRLAHHGLADGIPPHFLAVGLGGVWNFMGVKGKQPGPDGSNRNEKGLIPDLARLAWTKRRIFVVYDSNVYTNGSVASARRNLSSELTELGAKVLWVNIPQERRD